MRTLALLLVVILPCTLVASKPSHPRSSVDAGSRVIRISLVNLSGSNRQIRLSTDLLNLPLASRVDIESRIGNTLHIVSDTTQSIDQEIVVTTGDDNRLISIR